MFFFLQITANSPYLLISNETWHVFYLTHGVSEYKIPIHSSQVDQFVCTPYVKQNFKNGNV